MLPTLASNGLTPTRTAVTHHSINSAFAIRKGNRKLELCRPGSGGWSAPRDPDAAPIHLRKPLKSTTRAAK